MSSTQAKEEIKIINAGIVFIKGLTEDPNVSNSELLKNEFNALLIKLYSRRDDLEHIAKKKAPSSSSTAKSRTAATEQKKT